MKGKTEPKKELRYYMFYKGRKTSTAYVKDIFTARNLESLGMGFQVKTVFV